MAKKQPPDTIYLQWVGADKDDLTPAELEMQPSPGDVTWCSDRMFDTDVEYVRVTAPRKGQ